MHLQISLHNNVEILQCTYVMYVTKVVAAKPKDNAEESICRVHAL